MAIFVVDAFEVVQIDEQQREFGARHAVLVERFQKLIQTAAVGEAGQLVGAHQMVRGGELRLRLAQRIERDQQIFIAAFQMRDQLLFAGDEIRERTAHEGGEDRGLGFEQMIERRIFDEAQRARRVRNGAWRRANDCR